MLFCEKWDSAGVAVAVWQCGSGSDPSTDKGQHLILAVSCIISRAVAVHLENSSDLSSGRRPLSKSDEFSRWIAIVTEIMRGKVQTFSEK